MVMEEKDSRIEEILNHLDKEVQSGTMRMSVEIDENQAEHEKVTHSCCKVYGRSASRMVAELDMYSDLHLKEKKQRSKKKKS